MGARTDAARAEVVASRQLLLEEVVRLQGMASQQEVRAWWREAAVGLLTSLAEGMPVSLMEALSSGVPVVATAVGGIPEMIAAGVNGFVVPVNDPGAVADSIADILSSPEMATQMSHAARETALERFSLGHQVDSLLELWNQVLNSRHAA